VRQLFATGCQLRLACTRPQLRAYRHDRKARPASHRHRRDYRPSAMHQGWRSLRLLRRCCQLTHA